MGFTFAAFLAGNVPKIMPTAPETPNATKTEIGVITVLNSAMLLMNNDILIPSTTPMKPPKKLNPTASIRN